MIYLVYGAILVAGIIAIVLTVFEVRYRHLKGETPEDYKKFKRPK
jgi:hypothetical protein